MTNYISLNTKALADEPIPNRRAALSRLASLTPGTFYASKDLGPGKGAVHRNGLLPALYTLAATSPDTLAPGNTMTASFDGLSTNGKPYGDWEVRITRKDVITDSLITGEPSACEEELSRLDHDGLREQLGELANSFERSLFVTAGFGRGLGVRDFEDGSKADPMAQGAMYLCSELKPRLAAGETWGLDFTSALHGGEQADKWSLSILRKTIA